MICIVALAVFSILGVFSAKYRGYAKEAFHCVYRRATLRPCETAFDQKMKSKITGKLIKRKPGLAKFVYKHFEAISWAFMLTMFISLFFAASGLYNLFVYGTCDPANPETCILGIEPACGCVDDCTCEDGCESPVYEACKGNCTCIEDICT